MRAMRDYRTGQGAALLIGLCACLALPLSAAAGIFNPDVYGTGATMADYLRQVPGGGQPGGPAYDFRMGQYEITNAQYAAFLNDAQLDGGATGRGSNMVFDDDGRVRISEGGFTMFRGGPQLFVDYDLGKPVGQRFSTRTIEGIDFSNHPVSLVSWFGSLKFANWMTIDQGFGEAERAYAEGPNADDWHPVTITGSDWLTRDLNTSERQSLVNDVKGFRLPMDDQSSGASAFNEFYKAAAWDADDGVNRIYGFGRDTIDNLDANGKVLNPSLLRDDPFEDGTLPETTPVGFYDGTNWQQSDWDWPDNNFAMFQTRANENAFGIFDLTGNLSEWGQDKLNDTSNDRSVRGGNWRVGIPGMDADFRQSTLRSITGDNEGFRLVAIPEPSIGLMLGILTFLCGRHNKR